MLQPAHSGAVGRYLAAKARWAASAPAGLLDHHVVLTGPWQRHRGRPPERTGGRAPERALDALRPDVVLLHDPVFRVGLVEAAHAAGAWVVAVHHAPAPPLLKAMRRRCYRDVDAVMAAADVRAECGRAVDLPLRVGVHEGFHPRLGVPRGDETLYVGALRREKAVLTLLRAAARADEPWPLRIVGSGPLLPLIASRARRLGLGDRLRLQPFVDDPATLARSYARARCLVLPGEQEAYGLVALEAACCGARVVTCATAPVARAIGDRVADSFLPGDVDGLVGAIAAARAAPRPRRGAQELAARHRWAGVFTAELEGLRSLVR